MRLPLGVGALEWRGPAPRGAPRRSTALLVSAPDGARAAVLASGVGAFALPFLPHAHPGHDAVDEHALGEALEGQSRHMHQLHLIDEMLEAFGEVVEEGAEAAEAPRRLGA